MTISLCMIVKDEEETLARCLDGVKNCVDEIIVADTGSTDRTREIAEQYGCRVYPFQWTDDFSAARNFAFSKASGDYLLWLDADDVVTPENAERLVALRSKLEREKPDTVQCPYDVAFDETTGEPTTTFLRERILRRASNPVWQGAVHECIPPVGKIVTADFRVLHLRTTKDRGMRNLRIYQEQIEKGARLAPRDLFYYGRELYYHRLYREAIAVLQEMIEDESGWYVNRIEACKVLSLCLEACGKTEQALNAIFSSFRFGEPRAGALCAAGALLRKKGDLRGAIFWFTAALFCRDHSSEGDFENPTDRTLTPMLELTVCYYALGEHKKAVFYHKMAEARFSRHPSVVYNREFFRTKGLL